VEQKIKITPVEKMFHFILCFLKVQQDGNRSETTEDKYFETTKKEHATKSLNTVDAMSLLCQTKKRRTDKQSVFIL